MILIKPVVSEKTEQAKADGKYTFVVSADSTKPQIKKAIESFYGVTPIKINVLSGGAEKFKRSAKGPARKRAPFRKAVITLAEGQTLDINEIK